MSTDTAEKVRALEKYLDLTRNEFGRRMGLSTARAERLEKRLGDEKVIGQICRTYRVDPAYFTDAMSPKDVDRAVPREMTAAAAVGRLREARVRRGITRKALAEKMGISQQLVSAVERGERRMSGEFAESAAEVLDVGVDYLLCGDVKCRDNPVNQAMIRWLWDHAAWREKIRRAMRAETVGREDQEIPADSEGTGDKTEGDEDSGSVTHEDAGDCVSGEAEFFGKAEDRAQGEVKYSEDAGKSVPVEAVCSAEKADRAAGEAKDERDAEDRVTGEAKSAAYVGDCAQEETESYAAAALIKNTSDKRRVGAVISSAATGSDEKKRQQEHLSAPGSCEDKLQRDPSVMCEAGKETPRQDPSAMPVSGEAAQQQEASFRERVRILTEQEVELHRKEEAFARRLSELETREANAAAREAEIEKAEKMRRDETAIDVLNLSNRARNALTRYGITTVGELIAAGERGELYLIPGIGNATMRELLTAVREAGGRPREGLYAGSLKHVKY